MASNQQDGGKKTSETPNRCVSVSLNFNDTFSKNDLNRITLVAAKGDHLTCYDSHYYQLAVKDSRFKMIPVA